MSDNINKTPYRIGESFRNAPITKPITFQRRKPFFAMSWAGQGPTDVKRDFWKSGKVKTFPAVWNRAAKASTTAKLGVSRNELPSFNELGEAPGATAPSVTSTTERSWWGSLGNTLIQTGGAYIQKQQELQLIKAQAQAQQQSYGGVFPFNYRSQESGMGMLGWGVIVAGIGAIGYIVMKNR